MITILVCVQLSARKNKAYISRNGPESVTNIDRGELYHYFPPPRVSIRTVTDRGTHDVLKLLVIKSLYFLPLLIDKVVVKCVTGGHNQDGNAGKIWMEWVEQYCPAEGTDLVLLEGINDIRETFLAILNFKSKMVKACVVLSINPTKSQELISILMVGYMANDGCLILCS